MKLLTFHDVDGLKLGIHTDRGIVDVSAANNALGTTAPIDLATVIESGDSAIAELKVVRDRALIDGEGAEWLLDDMGVRVGPAVASPGKIICVGLNYRKHAIETNMPIPEHPVLFSKFNNTICGSDDNVPLPPVSNEYDYEVELGVVIGKTARNIEEDAALDHIIGYCTANDVSARDLQTRTPQWLLGKTLDNFLPIGPYLVTADDVADPQSLDLKCWVNGDLRQNSNTNDMIFSVAEIVSYISRYFPLDPGDVIVTGTPEGVAMGREDKPWLQHGDEVVVEVEGLGKLKNTMVA